MCNYKKLSLNFMRVVALCLYYTAIREHNIKLLWALIRTNAIFEFSEEIYNSEYNYWLLMVTNFDRRQVRVSFEN